MNTFLIMCNSALGDGGTSTGSSTTEVGLDSAKGSHESRARPRLKPVSYAHDSCSRCSAAAGIQGSARSRPEHTQHALGLKMPYSVSGR